MSVLPKQQRLLHVKSGNKCAICKRTLVESGDISALCEDAHIFGEKLGSARHDSSLDMIFVNSDENLICLCPNCHTIIDKVRPDEYTAEVLFEIKKRHEDSVRLSLLNNVSSGKISIDLARVIIHLGNMEMDIKDDVYSRTHLEYEISDKIDHNNIVIYKELIHEYGIYQSYLQGEENGLYKISTSEGGYEKRNIYNRIRSIYVEILGELRKEGQHPPYDGDQIFQAGYNKIRELIINSKEYVEMNDDDLMHCLYIVLVDAFIECKWFENPSIGGEIDDSSG